MIEEEQTGSFYDRDLKVLLRVKVSKETTLTHMQLLGQAADTDPSQSFNRGQLQGLMHNPLSGFLSSVACCR